MVQVCRPLMHEDADEFLDCVRVRTRPGRPSTRAAEQRRLGAYFFAWTFADLSAALALPGAQEAARELFDASLKLQTRLVISDADLCKLLNGPCQRVLNRKKELLASGVQLRTQ